MGDRAGFLGYLIESPIVHLEGLMEDQRMLDNIRRRRNLLEVLKEYQVKYYIATNPGQQGSCYSFREPGMVGPHAPTMQAKFCEAPVFRYHAGGYRSYIFDMNSLQ
jgi:hypothetical protein